MPGSFKLDHLQPFEPILSQMIFNFFTFILGGQFLLPQRANNGKREFIQLQNWMRQRGFSAWGIQPGPFAALWAHFVLEYFQLFHFHTGSQFLLPQRAINGEKGIQLQLTSKLDETDVRKGNSRNSRSSETEESQYLSDKRDRLQHVPTVFQLL